MGKAMTKTKVVALLACVCCMLWGSATPTIKVGYSLMHIGALDTASQIVFAGVRFAIAGILVLIFASIKDKKPALPTKAVLKYSVPTFITQTFIQYFFFYVGLAHASGVKSGIITGTGNFIAIFIVMPGF